MTRVALPPVPVSCAVLRYQEGAEGFYAVWDSWLLDTLALWQKQHEESYMIDENDDRVDALTRQQQEEADAAKALKAEFKKREQEDSKPDSLPNPKRMRQDEPVYVEGAPTVAAYLSGMRGQQEVA